MAPARVDGGITGGATTKGHTLPHNAVRTEQEIINLSRSILKIIFDYALNKIDHSESGFERGCQNFLPVVSRFVAEGKRVEACLPAFPFKSANKVYKVLGNLPDKAEELSLDRLNTICKRIQTIYPPGARITIVSDGIVYSDLLSISDQDTWLYGEALRVMAAEKKFDCIGFSTEKDLLDFGLSEEMREIIYVANCANFRRFLLNKYGNDNIDIDHEIATNPDTKLTYLGYKRFLESDLKHIFPRGAKRSGHAYTKDCKYIAKQMLIRGYAFAGAVKDAYPNHLRLSIHESIGAVAKISISLLNTKTGFTTPWHCSVAQLSDGEWVSAPMGEFVKNPRLELVQVDGVPSHFIEKPDKNNSGGAIELLTIAKPLTTSEYMSKAIHTTATTYEISLQNSDSLSSSADTDEAATSEGQSSPNTTPSIPENVAEQKMSSFSLSGQADEIFSTPYGRRLLPQIMDDLAAAEPSRTVYSLATPAGNSLGFKEISAHAFAQAINKLCWWLRRKAGRSNSRQPIGYIGPHDVWQVLLTYACMKVGHAVLFMSPNDNTEDIMAVIEATKCNVLITAGDMPPLPLVDKVLQLPLLDHLLDASAVKPYPLTKTFEEAINDPFCYILTSDTTGVPKPVPWSHGLIGAIDAVRLLSRVQADGDLFPWTSYWEEGDRIYSPFPMSHGAGVIMNIVAPALYNLHCILGPVDTTPSINLVQNLAETAKVNVWSLEPSFVDELGAHMGRGHIHSLLSDKFTLSSGDSRTEDFCAELVRQQIERPDNCFRVLAVFPKTKIAGVELP